MGWQWGVRMARLEWPDKKTRAAQRRAGLRLVQLETVLRLTLANASHRLVLMQWKRRGCAGSFQELGRELLREEQEEIRAAKWYWRTTALFQVMGYRLLISNQLIFHSLPIERKRSLCLPVLN